MLSITNLLKQTDEIHWLSVNRRVLFCKMIDSSKVECSTCGKTFNKKSNLYRHNRTIHGNSKPFDLKLRVVEPHVNKTLIKNECSICGKTFSTNQNLKRHARTIHGNPKLFECKQCEYKTTQGSNLKRHVLIKHSEKLKRPKIEQTKKKRNIKPILNIVGLPSPENHFAVDYFAQLTDEGYCTEAINCLSESWEYVRTKYTYGKLRHQYNIRLRTDDIDVTEMSELLLKIHELQSNAYKINIGWGRLLQHIETEEWRYFYPLANAQRYWNEPITIRNLEDLLKAIEFMDSQDITDHLTIQRPNTKYILKRIVNFNVVVYLLQEYPMMGDIDTSVLPAHILQHRFIKTLQKDTKGNSYKDPLCAFRCISYHLYHGIELQTKAKELSEQFRRFSDISIETFTGKVTIEQLFQLELCFKLKISVYSLDPKIETDEKEGAQIDSKTIDQYEAHLIRRSPIKKCDAENGELNLDLTNGHLSLITSIDNYAHSFVCNSCSKLFKLRYKCKLHQATCVKTSRNRAQYVGGAYKCPENSLFINLEELGIKINLNDIYCQFFR